MGRWTHHFKQLNDLANSIVSGLPNAKRNHTESKNTELNSSELKGSELNSSELNKAEPDNAVLSSFEDQSDVKLLQASVPSCDIETELLKGLETSLHYLEVCSSGWRYKSVPVFLFGVKSGDEHNSQSKAFLYHQMHLKTCCSALEETNYTVWVASDSAVFKHWESTHAFEVCHHCLMMTSYNNYRSLSSDQQAKLRAQFNFADYVKWYATDYFPDAHYSYWLPGEPLKPFEVGGNEDGEKCHNCRWPLPANSEHIVLDASPFDFNAPTCVCCIDNSPKIAVIDERVLLDAYAKRYWQWRNAYIEEQGLGTIASQNIKFSWAQLAYHFPRKWQPLIEALKQFEPADIYCLAENGYALLAWPRLRRAIVLGEQDKHGFPGGWEVWTYREVLENL